jgi:hypothetical protein
MSAFFLCESLLERRLALKLLGVVAIAGTLTVTWLYGPFLIAFFSEILPALASGQPGPVERGRSRAGACGAFPRPSVLRIPLSSASSRGARSRPPKRGPSRFRVLAAWGSRSL